MKAFENPGRKIKAVVSVFFIISIVFVALLAILVWIGIGSEIGGIGGVIAGFIIAAAFAALCLFLTWFSLILVSAFGEMCEKIDMQANEIRRIAEKIESNQQ